MALNAYRHVLKSARLAFEGDQHLFAAAQMQARTAFKSNAGLDPNDSLAKKAVIHAEEVAAILRQNIVQGKKEEGSERYSEYTPLFWGWELL